LYTFLSRADDFDFPYGAFGSRSTNEEVEHTHRCWWAWRPNEVSHALCHSGNNWQAEAWRRFRIITASFWYQLMFASGKQPHVTLLIDGALESRKVPVRLNSYQCNYLLFGLRSFFCVCFFDWFFGQFRSFGQEEQDGKQIRFFWIFVAFFLS
jgi:hypothetical protein